LTIDERCKSPPAEAEGAMLSGLVAIVTGGSSGIGEAIVRRFARENATVVILDVDLDGAQRVVADIPDNREAASVRCVGRDRRRRGLGSVVERHGTIDILINNAGIPPQLAPLDELSESDWTA
jgi:NAD(P)-dependent dehydrogenase (short-subunit alcohol dehydrogenase family)